MAAITPQKIDETGLVPTMTAAAESGGDTVVSNGNVFLLCKAGEGEGCVISVEATDTTIDISNYGPLTKANATLTLLTGEQGLLGPFPPFAFNSADGEGNISIDYTGDIPSLTIAALYYE